MRRNIVLQELTLVGKLKAAEAELAVADREIVDSMFEFTFAYVDQTLAKLGTPEQWASGKGRGFDRKVAQAMFACLRDELSRPEPSGPRLEQRLLIAERAILSIVQ